jgi:predicted unusual protein kinase regulating ubiquinone biosynthesis (AarF/ABC1/UbiB family)
MSITPMKKWGIDITSYQNELNHLIEQECDYTKEAAELDLWQEYLKNESHCFVPKVFHEYSNEFVLVQSLIEGVLIENVQEYWTQTEKKDVGEKLVKAYFYLLFKYRTMQGDTNHGNFLFNRKKQEVIFIDLGQTIHFEEKFINALIYILDKKYNEETYCSLSFFVALGFDKSKLENITPKLDLIINILFEPLFTNFANDLNDWDYKKQLDLLLGEDKWWFRSAGGTDFFLFMKSFMGLKNLICKLNTTIFFKGILQNILKELNSNNITIPIVSSNESTHFESHSKNIKILIIDKNVEKVKMTLPFMAIFDIDQYLNEPMLETIKNQKINLQEIIQNALKDGGLPKEVFRLEYDEKTIVVEFI